MSDRVFPRSPFPRTEFDDVVIRGGAVVYRGTEPAHPPANSGSRTKNRCGGRRGSVLNFARWGPPHDRGYWFPPFTCGPNGFGDPRKKFADSTRAKNWLLFTVDNCAECLAALQAVELMVYGIAYEMKQWPDDWEHRCWFDDQRIYCLCGQFSWCHRFGTRHSSGAELIHPWTRPIYNWFNANRCVSEGGAFQGHNWTWAAVDA